VYAVGPGRLTRERCFMAAVLACGERAMLSHVSAGIHWGILRPLRHRIEVTVIHPSPRRPSGIRVHRRPGLDIAHHQGIPVTGPIDTLVDLATRLGDDQLERSVNEAVNLDHTDPETLREAVAAMRYRAGAPCLLKLLDRDTFVVTDTRLEQQLWKIARAAGLPKPLTQRYLRGGRVDFYWPELGLIVEADSLRFHRTPLQQAANLVRDHRHAIGKLRTLRFSHHQIFHEPEHVTAVLMAVAAELGAA
jgi:very-short-patch-repair endonuclease